MRFKNLAIILTLTCLSIIAFAGLVLLPITGNCALITHNWEYYNDRTYANYAAIETSEGASWQVSASVDAKSVSAYVSPSDYNLSHFTQNDIFTGTGLVTASRDNYTYYHSSTASYIFLCPYIGTEGCLGHTVSGDIDTNHPSSPYFNGESSALTLDIQMSETVNHTCWARKKKTTVGGTVFLKASDNVVEAGSEFRVGWTKYVAIRRSVKNTVQVPAVAQNVGVDAGVSFKKKANTSAHVNFDFETVSDSGSVWYNAP